MNQFLNDAEYLFSIIAALIKRNDGQIRITEEEMNKVTKGDLVGLYFEPTTNTIVLKSVNPEKDVLHESPIVENNKLYEN